MNSEKTHADNAAEDSGSDAAAAKSNLITLEESKAVTPGKDINTKITDLDTDLAQLRMELGTINHSVEEGLDRLSDTDTDLTAKVSETYKRLGEIDNAYKSLLEISARINTDIKKLNGDVSSVAEQSASGIKNLEQSSLAQSNEFTQKNQQVASRVNHLVETSKLSSELLSQKIQSTTEMILQIEKKVVGEIDSLSSVTKEKTDSIVSTVDGNKAKILKLQSVDEAIIRRATTLEISSAELTVTSQRLDASVEQLELSSDMLSHGINALKERTAALEETAGRHGTLIDGLQKTTADIADKIAILANRESKHFNIVTAGFLFLLAVTAVIYFSQQNEFGLSDARFAKRSEIVDSKIDSLQLAQTSSEDMTNGSFAALEEKIVQVEDKMLAVQDKVQSVDGRLSQASPFSQIGDDNVIHGPQWIAGLPQENFTVQLAYTGEKNTLYEIAHRYNYNLKDTLSYFEANDNGATHYVLLSGNYITQQQARAAADKMPVQINRQRPQVRKLSDIQKYIAR